MNSPLSPRISPRLAGVFALALMPTLALAQAAGPKSAPATGMTTPVRQMADPKAIARQQVELLDTNKDGKVSKDEFMARTIEAFKSLDGNKDGFVSEKEFAAHVEKRMQESAARSAARAAAPKK